MRSAVSKDVRPTQTVVTFLSSIALLASSACHVQQDRSQHGIDIDCEIVGDGSGSGCDGGVYGPDSSTGDANGSGDANDGGADAGVDAMADGGGDPIVDAGVDAGSDGGDECTEPYQGWSDSDKTQRTFRISLGQTLKKASRLDIVKHFCAGMTIIGWPTSAFDVYAYLGGKTEIAEGVSNECVYSKSSSASFDAMVHICGVQFSGGGGWKKAFEKQGCLDCEDPPRYDCSLDESAGGQAGGDGCWSDTDTLNAKGRIGKEYDWSKLFSSLNVPGLDITGWGNLGVTLSADKEDKKRDGRDACTGEDTCPELDLSTVGGRVTVDFGGTAQALLLGYAGLKATAFGEIYLGGRAGYDAASDRICVDAEVGGSFGFALAGRIRVRAGGTIVDYDQKILTVTCSGDFASNSCDPNADAPAWDCSIAWELDERTIVPAEVTCDDAGYDCGTFTDSLGSHDCGSCATGLSCQSRRDRQGTVCGCEIGDKICDDNDRILRCGEGSDGSTGYYFVDRNCRDSGKACSLGIDGVPQCTSNPFEDPDPRIYECGTHEDCEDLPFEGGFIDGVCFRQRGSRFGVCLDPDTGEPIPQR